MGVQSTNSWQRATRETRPHWSSCPPPFTSETLVPFNNLRRYRVHYRTMCYPCCGFKRIAVPKESIHQALFWLGMERRWWVGIWVKTVHLIHSRSHAFRCFFHILLHLLLFAYSFCYVDLSNWLWSSSDPKGKLLFYAFIRAIKFFCILYFSTFCISSNKFFPSTGQENNTAQPKADKWCSSPSDFS